MKLNQLIEKLITVEPQTTPFLSIYLNAEANEQGRDNYLTWLKNQLSDINGNYAEDSEEAQSLKADTERIMNFLENEVEASADGIAIFANSTGDFFETIQIEVPFPNNRIFAFNRPHIFPLARTIDQNPKYAVLWADTNKADIYIFGGENDLNAQTETNAKVEEIKNDVTQRSQAGGWSQARFQRRIENFHLQHAKETVEELDKLIRNTKIEYLILCGDETTIMPTLRPQLTKELEDRVVDVINMSQYTSEEEIRAATHQVMQMKNATEDKARVERVFDAAHAAAGLGTLGVEDTLAALSNGQVEELVISSTFDAIEYNQKKVKKVLKDYAPGDDNSASDELPEVKEPRQIADELIIRAINSAAQIRFIEDASLLKEAGGVGTVLRYKMNSTANS